MTDKSTIYVYCKTVKSQGTVTGLYNHNERQKEEYLCNGNIDPARTDMNFSIIKCESPYMDSVNDAMRYARRFNSNTVILIDGLVNITESEWSKSLDAEEIGKVFSYALKYMTERFGEANFISAVVHMDETRPHMHFEFIPVYERNGRWSFCFYRRMQELYGTGPYMFRRFKLDFESYMMEMYPIGPGRAGTGRRAEPMEIFKANPVMFRRYLDMYDAVDAVDSIDHEKKVADAMMLYNRIAEQLANEMLLKRSEIMRRDAEIENLRAYYDRYLSEFEINDGLRKTVEEYERRVEEQKRIIGLIPEPYLEQAKRKIEAEIASEISV